MIFVTGDTHIPIDIEKLNEKLFPEQQYMSRNDYVIVCGDFGGLWDDSERHVKWLKWLAERPFTLLFADGNHENFDMLEKFPVSEWNGGKVHFIADNIIHLMRGQVFIIDGKYFFVMGGGASTDKDMRVDGISWWGREMPSEEEFREGLNNLKNVGFDVDYVITHTAPSGIIEKFRTCPEEKPLNEYLRYVADTSRFKKWFFGHVHTDCEPEKNFIAVYDKIYDLDGGAALEEHCKDYDKKSRSAG